MSAKIRNQSQPVHRKKRNLAPNFFALGYLYNLVAQIAWRCLQIGAFFSAKLKLFTSGRQTTFSKLQNGITRDDQVIWLHAASLGEFEQGLPIIERLKKEYTNYKFLATFFSPSGYEVKKNTTAVDLVAYLPLDTLANAKRFLGIVQPKLAIFVKYEVWPNYMALINAHEIPVVLVSAIFSTKQIYFKWYGGFMRKTLGGFSHIFLQDASSQALLASIGIKNTSVCGDTRLDRVSEIAERDNTLEFMPVFKKDNLCLVAGSTWEEDENLLVPYINTAPKKMKFVIAPHKIDPTKINTLLAKINKKTALFTTLDLNTIGDYDVLIIDTIGLLTKVYYYADFAYVGGGFSTGLHNTLEPAVFGIPVIIGPKYTKFKEAKDLVEKGGILSINDSNGFNMVVNNLLGNSEYRKKTGAANAAYISKNKGASIQIVALARTLL